MSHPIDEIFRRGLSEAEFDGHDRSWKDAKNLLGLRKSRNRRFIWLLFFAAVGFGLGIYAWISNPNDDTIEVGEPYIADDGVSADRTISDVGFGGLSEDAGATDQDLTSQNENHNEDVSGKVSLDNSVVKSPGDNSASYKRLEKSTSGSDTRKVPTSSRTPNDIAGSIPQLNEEGTLELDVPVINQTNERGEETNSKFEESTLVLSISDEAPSDYPSKEQKENTVQEIVKSNDDALGGEDFSLIQKEEGATIAIPSQEGSAISLEFISKLPLLDLVVITGKSLPELKFVELKVDNKSSRPLSFGVYAALHPFNSHSEGGILLDKELGKKWSIDGGFGISRSSSNQSGNSEEFANLRSDTGFSINDYRYTGIMIPMRLTKKVSNNALSLGLMLERPISLDGLLVFEVPETAFDQDLADPMTLGGGSPVLVEPVSYRLDDVSSLDKWHLHLQLAYGRMFLPKTELSVGLDYRWSDISIFPSDLEAMFIDIAGRDPKLQFRLVLRQHF